MAGAGLAFDELLARDAVTSEILIHGSAIKIPHKPRKISKL